jgi:hypothetical protein
MLQTSFSTICLEQIFFNLFLLRYLHTYFSISLSQATASIESPTKDKNVTALLSALAGVQPVAPEGLKVAPQHLQQRQPRARQHGRSAVCHLHAQPITALKSPLASSPFLAKWLAMQRMSHDGHATGTYHGCNDGYRTSDSPVCGSIGIIRANRAPVR